MNKTEEAICDALLDLMEEQPLRTIKVTKLVERAGVSRSTFYAYFDCIEDVVQRIEDDYFEHGPSEEPPLTYTLDDAQWRRYMQVMSQNLRTYGILTGPNGDPAFTARLEERDRMLMEGSAPQSDSDRHSSVEREVVHEFVHGGKMRAARWWAEHSDEISTNDFSDIMAKLIRACMRVARR